MVFARVVPQKGIDDYAVCDLKKIGEQMGYKRILMKSDNEPSILLLKDLVRKETDVEIIMEETPVGDHQANGMIENAIKNIQGQFRALKDALESRLGARIDGDHVAIPWLVMHAGSVMCRRRVDREGFTPFRRWKGRPFARPVAEFGENVWYLPANSVGKNKFETRWREGVWLGVRMESGEAIIGTSEGVLKARDFRRKPENGGRWNKDDFNKFVGVPWELYPGIKGSVEIRSKVRLPQEPAEVARPVAGRDEYVPRRFRIQKGDLQAYGYTTGCPGCRAANRGMPAVGHSEECRRRIQRELEQAGDQRIERESARAFAYFGDKLDEKEKKKPRKSETMGMSDPQSTDEPPTKNAQMEDGQDDSGDVIMTRKREVDEAWEGLAKRLRPDTRPRVNETESKGEMDVDAMVNHVNAVLEQAMMDEDEAALNLRRVVKEHDVEGEECTENTEGYDEQFTENMEGYDEQFEDGRTGEQLDTERVREAREE